MNGLALIGLLALHVQAVGGCPTGQEVEAKLGPLLVAGNANAASDVALLTEDSSGGVGISLLTPDGSTRFTRQFRAAASCAEQAQIVAVALAAWESDIHPPITLRLDGLASAGTASAAAGPSEAAVSSTRPLSEAAQPTAFVLGAAAFTALLPDLTPGARVEAGLGRGGQGLRWILSANGLGNHEATVGSGQASWWRLYCAAGPDYALRIGRRWDVAVGAAPLIGLLMVSGTGYSVDRDTRGVDVGVEARFRVEARWASWAPWVGVTAASWLRRQTVATSGAPEVSMDLPRFEPMISIGADFYGSR